VPFFRGRGEAPSPRARKSCTSCTGALGCAATQGGGTSLLDRQATGTTPTWRPWSTFIIATGPPRRPRALGRHDGGHRRQEAARRKRLLVRSFFNKRVASAYLSTEQPSAPGLNTTTRSHQPHPVLASSVGWWCWLATTPPECLSEGSAVPSRQYSEGAEMGVVSIEAPHWVRVV
jgi:hypothetical protein